MRTLELLEQEAWWGGLCNDGIRMPFGGAQPFVRDLAAHLAGNQGTPLLLSSKGRYIWSDVPYAFQFDSGTLQIEEGKPIVEACGEPSLRGAFTAASRQYFPPSGQYPDLAMFTSPQYNLWIEMMYEPSQQGVLAYAEAVIANGMPPGVLMIDDNWQEHYGTMTFHSGRFPDPARMMERLHELGFQAMLWVSPFVSPDSTTFRFLKGRRYLLKDAAGEIAIRPWWNGYSALLDLTNHEAVQWLHDQLEHAVNTYGIDGFKFDAGDPHFYREGDGGVVRENSGTTIHEHCEQWGRIGLSYRFNEYRACWKLGGQPLAQRLRDKRHEWGEEGLASLIPNGLALGLIGHPYLCPDMIGGGEIESFTGSPLQLDQELFVRSAQCSALFPMMQFSAAPWRVLDAEHLICCVEAANLHSQLGTVISELARHASVTGEPIMRHMAYVFPDGGYEEVNDQFMLGDGILVAPVLEQGARARVVRIPPGTWEDDTGSLIKGPAVVNTNAPLIRLPWYQKLE